MPQVQTVRAVQTVRGPVDPADLGQVLVHEHVFVLDPEIAANHPGEWGDEDARVADTSVLPEVPTRGPAATAVLVGERAADLLLG